MSDSAVLGNGTVQGVEHSNANLQNDDALDMIIDKADETNETAKVQEGKRVRHIIKLHGSIICALHGSRCMAYQNRQ